MFNATEFYGVNAPLFTTPPPIPPPQLPGLDFKQFSPGVTRVLAHITVTLVILVAGRFGQNAMSDYARSSMWAGNTVPLSYLGGWMTPSQMLGWMWKFRQVPGGLYFAPMALTVLCGIATNLLIATFVTAIAVPGVCTGKVIVATANSSIEWKDGQSPLATWFSNALQAQVYSMANGGLPGLYWAAPLDPVFRATEEDVASSCSCSLSWTSARIAGTNGTATYDTMVAAVGGANNTATCGVYPSGAWVECVAVSTDFTNPYNLQVRFAIDSLTSNRSAGSNLTLHGYTCSLPNIPWLQGRVLGSQFTRSLSSVVQPRIVNDTGAMQDVLMVTTNTMFAINGYALWGSANVTETGAKFGCIKVASRVELPACVFILACLAALVGWSIAWLVALTTARGTLHTCPMGLKGWVDQAIRQKGAPDIFGDTKISPKRRRDWAIGIHRDFEGGTPYVSLVDCRTKT